MCEKIWLEFCKIKWPTLVIGSEEYNARRKAFYVGMFSAMGIIAKTPESAMDTIVTKIFKEASAEVKRGDAEVLAAKTNKIIQSS